MEYNIEHLKEPIINTPHNQLTKDNHFSYNTKDRAYSGVSNKSSAGADDSFVSKATKGRKRNIVLKSHSMHELINDHVIPRWKEYLKQKSDRGISKTHAARPDTIWKKILRDVREFFRILFRKRFHYLEFQDVDGASK